MHFSFTHTDLTSKETIAVEYILLCNIGKDFSLVNSVINTPHENRTMASTVAKFAQMTGKELLVHTPKTLISIHCYKRYNSHPLFFTIQRTSLDPHDCICSKYVSAQLYHETCCDVSFLFN